MPHHGSPTNGGSGPSYGGVPQTQAQRAMNGTSRTPVFQKTKAVSYNTTTSDKILTIAASVTKKFPYKKLEN